MVSVVHEDGESRSYPLSECIRQPRHDLLFPVSVHAPTSVTAHVWTLLCYLRHIRMPPERRAAMVLRDRQVSLVASTVLLAQQRQQCIDDIIHGRSSPALAAASSRAFRDSLRVDRLNPTQNYFSLHHKPSSCL